MAGTAILERFPQAELSFSAVWIDVLRADAVEHALASSVILRDPRVRHFYDPNRRAGRALAPLIGLQSMTEILEPLGVPPEKLESSFKSDFVRGDAAVFDAVFFFDARSEWTDAPPHPLEWATQLDPSVYKGFDAERWFWADDLRAELERLAARVLAPDAEDLSGGEEPR